MFHPPEAMPPPPVPPRPWHPGLAVPAVVVATLVVPPLGAALAFMARWDKAGKAVTVVLASIWFAVLVAADPGPKAAPVDAKSDSRPAVTTTVTVTAPPPVPLASPPSTSATPAPVSSSPVTVATPTAPNRTGPGSDPASGAVVATQPQVPQDRPARPRSPQADDDKAKASGTTVAGGGPSSRGGSATGGNSGVTYRNCAAVKAAGAAPIHREDAGYGRHLDRDGDGVACE